MLLTLMPKASILRRSMVLGNELVEKRMREGGKPWEGRLNPYNL